MQEVLTLQRLAEVLSISLQTAQGLCRAGEIDAFKIGGGWRIPESALDEFMERKVRENKTEDPELSLTLEIWRAFNDLTGTKTEITPEDILKRVKENRKG